MTTTQRIETATLTRTRNGHVLEFRGKRYRMPAAQRFARRAAVDALQNCRFGRGYDAVDLTLGDGKARETVRVQETLTASLAAMQEIVEGGGLRYVPLPKLEQALVDAGLKEETIDDDPIGSGLQDDCADDV